MIQIKFLDWDSRFFNKNIGEIVMDSTISNSQLRELLKDAKSGNFDVIYLFSDFEIKNTIINEFKGMLVDVKNTFKKRVILKHPANSRIKSFNENDLCDKIVGLSRLSGNYSRFNIDQKFSLQDFNNLYDEWLKKSISREIADEVFVYVEQKETLGFVTISLKEKKGYIGLIAVNPSHQGKEIGTHLLSEVENFLIFNNINELYVPTQKTNILACRFYTKNNFKLESSKYIYHLAPNS
tara:strand:+ start:1254 stop:1967 length:714 start_codon:yes stop_codon:yes gene_type:complete